MIIFVNYNKLVFDIKIINYLDSMESNIGLNSENYEILISQR